MELNKIRSVSGKVLRIRNGIILTIVGIFFAVIGGIIASKSSNVNYIETSGTITEIGNETDTKGVFECLISYSTHEGEKTVELSVENPFIDKEVIIYYDESDPTNVSTTKNGNIVPFVIIGVGAVAAVGGVIMLVRAFKTKNPDQFDQVDLSKVSQEQIDEVSNNDEPLTEYYFHFCGKMNQSYILETPNRSPIIEINCDKFKLIGKSEYTFYNRLTGRRVQHLIGKTVTYSYGAGSLSVNAKSSFKVDDSDVFKLIADRGYSISVNLEKLAYNFVVSHYGVTVATLKAAGANVAKANSKGSKLGNIPTQGVYVINAKESDLDMVALIAFAVSRVEF